MLPTVAHRVIDLASRSRRVAVDHRRPRVEGPGARGARPRARQLRRTPRRCRRSSTVAEAVVRLGIVGGAQRRRHRVASTSRMHDPAVYGARGRELVDHAIGTAYVARLIAERARDERRRGVPVRPAARHRQARHPEAGARLPEADRQDASIRAIVELARRSSGTRPSARWRCGAGSCRRRSTSRSCYHHDYQAGAATHREGRRRRLRAPTCWRTASGSAARRCRRRRARPTRSPTSSGSTAEWLDEVDARAPGLVAGRPAAAHRPRRPGRRPRASVTLRVEDLADLADQRVERERLLQEGVRPPSSTRGSPMRLVGVARHVDDLHVGPRRQQPLGERRTAHLRHHDVGDQQIDRAVVRLAATLERLDAVARPSARGSRVPSATRAIRSRTPSSSSTSSSVSLPRGVDAGLGRRARLDGVDGSADPRQVDADARAHLRLAVDPDVAVALLDDAVDRREARGRCRGRAPWS